MLEDQRIALSDAIYRNRVELHKTLWWATERRARLQKNIDALQALLDAA